MEQIEALRGFLLKAIVASFAGALAFAWFSGKTEALLVLPFSLLAGGIFGSFVAVPDQRRVMNARLRQEKESAAAFQRIMMVSIVLGMGVAPFLGKAYGQAFYTGMLANYFCAFGAMCFVVWLDARRSGYPNP